MKIIEPKVELYYGTTGTPHPNCIIIAGMIRNNLMELGYDFRD